MDYATTFVNEFCNQLALTQKGMREMHSWYLFSDKRPETIRERFEADAKEFFEIQNLFQGGVR